MLNQLAGNGEALSSLQTALKGGRLPHAILLAAPDGCGRGFAARCLAADFLFPQGGPGAKAVLQNQSPEVLLVEGEGKSGNIPVERVRQIRADVFHSALSAAGRVVLIKDAHRMAPPAYNALLKVLEEPPADALFILTAHDAAAIPATIRSRCALYPLAPASLAECEARLRESEGFAGKDESLPPLLAAVYGGRIGSGLRALQNPARLAILLDALAAAKAAAAGNGYEMLRIFAAYEGRADGERENRQALLADMGDVLCASLRGLSAPGLPTLSPRGCAALLPFVNDARGQLARNAAPKTVFTALAVQLRRAVV